MTIINKKGKFRPYEEGLATEDTLVKSILSIENAISETAYNLLSAPYSSTTNISNDFIFDSITLNFSTTQAKTITITSSDGTILWGGSVDTSASNLGYNTTKQNFNLIFDQAFNGGDNLTVTVTQTGGACLMDCVLKIKQGGGGIAGNPVLAAGNNHIGSVNIDNEIRLVDDYGFEAEFTPVGQIRTVPTYRLIASGFPGTTLDDSVWTNTNVGSGTLTLSGGIGTFSTGVTANSSAKVITPTAARFISGRTNFYRGNIRIPDAGVTNNVRRWGAFDTNNGLFFQISGSTFSVVSRKSTTDTVVNQVNWNRNAFVLSDNMNHVYEIYWGNQNAWFVVDGVLVHEMLDGITTLSDSIQLKCSIENVNSNGLTTNVVLEARGQGVNALGELKSDGKPLNITTAGTYVLKRGAGYLHQITCNDGPTGSSIVLYNNTSAAGTIISTINTAKIATPVTLFSPGFTFDIGLTLVMTGNVNITIVWD